MKSETLETRIINRIERKRGDVFLRSDFKDLGGYDQVGRVLRDLVRKGMLLKVSYGLYTRAVESPFSETPVPPKGLETLTEALRRVGVEVVQTRLEREYNAGLTTQVPTGRVVGVRRRVRRKIGYDGINLILKVLDKDLIERIAGALGTRPGLIEKDWYNKRPVFLNDIFPLQVRSRLTYLPIQDTP